MKITKNVSFIKKIIKKNTNFESNVSLFYFKRKIIFLIIFSPFCTAEIVIRHTVGVKIDQSGSLFIFLPLGKMLVKIPKNFSIDETIFNRLTVEKRFYRISQKQNTKNTKNIRFQTPEDGVILSFQQ